MSFITCGSGDGPDEVFCLWFLYEDIPPQLSNEGWAPPPSMPFPLPFGIKGHKSLGKCLVATRPIAAGDLIACERPILIMPDYPQGNIKDLERNLEEMFYRLKGSAREFLHNVRYPGLQNASSLGKKLAWLLTNHGTLVTFFKSEHLPYYRAFFPIISRCCHRYALPSLLHSILSDMQIVAADQTRLQISTMTHWLWNYERSEISNQARKLQFRTVTLYAALQFGKGTYDADTTSNAHVHIVISRELERIATKEEKN